jgi:hypothetical protein
MPATKQWTYSRGKKGTVVGVEGERRKTKKNLKDLAAENQEAARSRRLGAALLLI